MPTLPQPLTLQYTLILLDLYETDQGRGYRLATAAEDGYDADDVTFGDYTTNCRLAAQGLFSIDRKAHRAARDAEAARQAELDQAYAKCGQDRQAAYGRILKLLEGKRTGGIWARSTAEYTNARDALDRLMTAQAAMIVEEPEEPAVDIRIRNCGTLVMLDLVSDEAREWADINVEVPSWAWLGEGFAIDPRLVEPLIAGAVGDGLQVIL